MNTHTRVHTCTHSSLDSHNPYHLPSCFVYLGTSGGSMFLKTWTDSQHNIRSPCCTSFHHKLCRNLGSIFCIRWHCRQLKLCAMLGIQMHSCVDCYIKLYYVICCQLWSSSYLECTQRLRVHTTSSLIAVQQLGTWVHSNVRQQRLPSLNYSRALYSFAA